MPPFQAGASIAEVTLLALLIRETFPPDDLAALRDRLDAAARATRGLDVAARFALRLPCPLFDRETQACLAYAARPANCRAYRSLSLPASEAKHAAVGRRIDAPQLAPRVEGVRALKVGQMLGLRQAGLAEREVDIVFGLPALLAQPALIAEILSGGDPLAALET